MRTSPNRRQALLRSSLVAVVLAGACLVVLPRVPAGALTDCTPLQLLNARAEQEANAKDAQEQRMRFVDFLADTDGGATFYLGAAASTKGFVAKLAKDAKVSPAKAQAVAKALVAESSVAPGFDPAVWKDRTPLIIETFLGGVEIQDQVNSKQITAVEATRILRALSGVTAQTRKTAKSSLATLDKKLNVELSAINKKVKALEDCLAASGVVVANCTDAPLASGGSPFVFVVSMAATAADGCIGSVTTTTAGRTTPPASTAPPTTAPTTAPPTTTTTACTQVGSWVDTTSQIGSTSWTITASGVATQSGIGNAKGSASLAGHDLTITWIASDTVTTGVIIWTLAADCRSGNGTLTFTGPPSRVGENHTSTVVRTGGG